MNINIDIPKEEKKKKKLNAKNDIKKQRQSVMREGGALQTKCNIIVCSRLQILSTALCLREYKNKIYKLWEIQGQILYV